MISQGPETLCHVYIYPRRHVIHAPGTLPIYLQGVHEIRPLVTLDHDLLLGQAIEHIIPLTGPPLAVLGAQREVHEDGAAQQEEGLEAEHDAVAGPVPRLLERDVDVGRHDAVQVAPADDHAEHDGALQRPLGVVRHPRQRVGDGRVDADGAQERPRVLYVRLVGR